MTGDQTSGHMDHSSRKWRLVTLLWAKTRNQRQLNKTAETDKGFWQCSSVVLTLDLWWASRWQGPEIWHLNHGAMCRVQAVQCVIVVNRVHPFSWRSTGSKIFSKFSPFDKATASSHRFGVYVSEFSEHQSNWTDVETAVAPCGVINRRLASWLSCAVDKSAGMMGRSCTNTEQIDQEKKKNTEHWDLIQGWCGLHHRVFFFKFVCNTSSNWHYGFLVVIRVSEEAGCIFFCIFQTLWDDPWGEKSTDLRAVCTAVSAGVVKQRSAQSLPQELPVVPQLLRAQSWTPTSPLQQKLQLTLPSKITKNREWVSYVCQVNKQKFSIP